MVEKDRTDPRVGSNGCSRVRERDTSGHAGCRRPLRPERVALALWAMPAHASSTASTTTDDNLAVHDDANSLRSGEQKISAPAVQ